MRRAIQLEMELNGEKHKKKQQEADLKHEKEHIIIIIKPTQNPAQYDIHRVMPSHVKFQFHSTPEARSLQTKNTPRTAARQSPFRWSNPKDRGVSFGPMSVASTVASLPGRTYRKKCSPDSKPDLVEQ